MYVDLTLHVYALFVLMSVFPVPVSPVALQVNVPVRLIGCEYHFLSTCQRYTEGARSIGKLSDVQSSPNSHWQHGSVCFRVDNSYSHAHLHIH